MLKLKHSKLFDQDPYGDVMDCTLIGTIGASIMMILYMLVPLPKANMSLLYISMFVALGLGICSIPIYVGRLNKLKAYLFYTIVFSISIYGSTLFSNIPIAFMIWVPVLVFITYLPLIRYPSYIFMSGIAVGISIDVANSGSDGSIYIANMRMITFLLIMSISSLFIVFYPQYLGYKRRVALWLCIESLEIGVLAQSLEARVTAVEDYTRHMGKYQGYQSIEKKEDHLQAIATEIQQCFLTYIYIHDNDKLMEAAQKNSLITPFIKDILLGFSSATPIQIPDDSSSGDKEIILFKNNLMALAAKTNEFLDMNQTTAHKYAT